MSLLRRATKFLGGVFVLAFAFTLAAPLPAQAAEQNFLFPEHVQYLDRCGKFWPSEGSFQTARSGNQFSVQMNFKLTHAEKNSLACVGPLLELDFRILGFNAPAEWDNYTATSNLPYAIHDTAVQDPGGNAATPGLTRIRVADIIPNQEYHAIISFSLTTNGDSQGPRVSVEWVRSYWATSFQQTVLCASTRYNISDAMCVFGTARAYLSHGYNNNVSLTFDGYRQWQYGVGSPTASSTPSTDVAISSAPVNYMADRTILHGPDGSLYVMAGGAKFSFSSMSQFSSLGYSTSGMVYLSSQQVGRIPNGPRDGTVLQGGGGQLYVIAGGAKFYFGSMTEFNNQGYSSSQVVKVPQGPLDAIGDAPGNRPVTGVVLQHPDGRVYVMAGGVKFQFGTMSQFFGLGYSSASIIRVSGAALDAIPNAFTQMPPSDGTVIRSGGGQIYVIAGGAKFYYGSMAEYFGLGARETDWINVPQGPLDSIGDAPGNIPRNGTVLRSGGGQLYVIAGGAKFYFGSMTEFNNQGYTTAQSIAVPQAPLDGIGDAPGNMPRNGTVIHRPDGSIFVIAGGVKWVFGGMDQFYQLGYSYSQIMRVSWAPTDGILDASATNPPANGVLLQGTDVTVWVMKDGVRRAFTGAQQVADLGYSWNNLVRVPDAQLATIPSGGPLP